MNIIYQRDYVSPRSEANRQAAFAARQAARREAIRARHDWAALINELRGRTP